MRTLTVTNKELYHTILRSAIVYLVCMIICFLHVLDVYKTNVSQVRERQGDLVVQAGNLTQEYFAGLYDLVLQSGEEIAVLSEDAGVYREILERLCRFGKFDKAIYVKNAVIYTESGKIAGARVSAIWKQIADTGVDAIRLIENVWEENDRYLMFPVETSCQDGQQAYLIAFYDCVNVLRDERYEEVTSDCQSYLISRDGLILDVYNHEDVQVEGDNITNFFVQLSKLSDGEHVSTGKIQNLKVDIRNNDSLRIILNGEDAHPNLVSIEKVDGVEEIYIAAVMDQRSQMDNMYTYIRRTVYFMLALMGMMMVPIIFMWLYSKGVMRRMEKLAYTDEVTGGRNVNFFRKEAMNILELHPESPYLIQRFDILNFRYLNETYGHLRADEILKACVSIYHEIYSNKELCVRMDSDQFLALTLNDSGVEERRNEYCKRVNQYATQNGIKYPIRMKFGIYQLRKQDRDIDVMIDRANIARRSLAGNDAETVAYYSDAILLQTRKADKIESEMQQALENGEFKVYLQAKWDVQENKVAGAEALVRWIKPDGNMVYPDEFIPVFERNGFIEKLDFYMLEAVCKRMQQVIRDGGTVYPISINQSRMLLHNPEYIAHVTDILKQYEMPQKYIELEVTETALFDDKERMIHILQDLKSENIPLAMDDFGSGYSSLNVLKDMPFDILKIDRAFFSESITSESSTLILQKIIEMADGLGLEVICEGVETQQQVELLREMGCRRVQGYFYARPIPMEEYIRQYCNCQSAEGK